MAFLGFGKKSKDIQKETTPVLEASKAKKPAVVKSAPRTPKASGESPKTPKAFGESPKVKEVKPVSSESTKESFSDYTGVLLHPRITEKSAIIAEEGNVYTFDVHPRATKKEVLKAVLKNYNIRPFRINISTIRQKKVFSRGKVGFKAGGKKAMVYLKKGDKIEFV